MVIKKGGEKEIQRLFTHCFHNLFLEKEEV